jgi:tetratricopeptide (TPR) repeat protein
MRPTCLWRTTGRWLRSACLGIALAPLTACTPTTAALVAALPEGTASAVLGNIKGMEEGNQRRVAGLEARKDWDGLVKLAEENISKDRNNADWWLVAGYAHSQAGRHAQAAQHFAERVRLAPDDLLGWNFLAQSYRDAGQPQRAVQTLNNAHLVRPGTPATWYLLGESYSDLDRYLPAAAAYREAVQLERGFAQAWFGLGRAYARLGRRAEYNQALEALQQLSPALAKELAVLRPPSRN